MNQRKYSNIHLMAPVVYNTQCYLILASTLLKNNNMHRTAKIGERKMTITVEKQPPLMNFDIVQESQKVKSEFVTKTFTVMVTDGILNIQISSDKEAVISGISLQAYAAIRIRAGITNYKDTNGNIWTIDKDYTSGGNLWGPTYPYPSIANTKDDPLYLMERCGDFRYYFQGLNNGIYTVRLHFAELYFTNKNLRVFNVSVQHAVAFSNVDIFQKANNTRYRALILDTKAFVKNGLLVVEFAAIKNYPKISAIEII
jgi:Malectin domain